jgi:hypothetical protein
LILYVPATLAPVLTNMRYTVTVQPLIFMFIAVTIAAGLKRSTQAHDVERIPRAAQDPLSLSKGRER